MSTTAEPTIEPIIEPAADLEVENTDLAPGMDGEEIDFFNEPEPEGEGEGEPRGEGEGEGELEGEAPKELTKDTVSEFEVETESGVKFKAGDAIEIFDAVASTIDPYINEGESVADAHLRVVENGYIYLGAIKSMSASPEAALSQINGLVKAMVEIHADKFKAEDIDFSLLKPDNLSDIELALQVDNAKVRAERDRLASELTAQRSHFEARMQELKPQIDSITKQNLLSAVQKQIKAEYNEDISTAELGELAAKHGSDEPLKAWLTEKVKLSQVPKTTKPTKIPSAGDKVLYAKDLTADEIMRKAKAGYTIK
jgi:hypothetical protein